MFSKLQNIKYLTTVHPLSIHHEDLRDRKTWYRASTLSRIFLQFLFITNILDLHCSMLSRQWYTLLSLTVAVTTPRSNVIWTLHSLIFLNTLEDKKHWCGLPLWLSGIEFACHARHVGSVPELGRSPGGGNGNPFQYSCQERPKDWGAWWAVVHEVAEADVTMYVTTGETRLMKVLEHEHQTDKCAKRLGSKQWARSNWIIRKQHIVRMVDLWANR